MKALGNIKFGNIDIKILANSQQATVAELHFAAGEKASTHRHEHEEFNYVVKGVFDCMCQGETTRIHPGDLVQVPPHTDHNLHCVSQEAGVIVTFWTPSRRDFMEKIQSPQG